jgi:hypothetical protein
MVDSKTLLIVAILIIIVVIITSPTGCAENYSASFDPKYIDPLIHPYSKNINFRPDVQKLTGDYDPTGVPSNKVYDHLVDQYNGYDVEMVDSPIEPEDVNPADQPVGRTGYMNRTNIRTSYDGKQIVEDPVFESNNIGRYCAGDMAVASYDNMDLPDMNSNVELDMDSRTYYDLLRSRNSNKTFVQINENSGKYDQTNTKREQDIQGLAEIKDYMENNRKNTMDSIYGLYRGAENVNRGVENNRCGIKMYD